MIRPELALLFCLGALAGLPTHTSAAPDLNVTRQLVLDGRYESAYAELTPLVAEQAGAIAFDYLYGVAALETGRAVEAILAFERVLDQEPDNVEARALSRARCSGGRS